MVIRSLRGRRALAVAAVPVLLLASACGLEKTEKKSGESSTSSESPQPTESPDAAAADGTCVYPDAAPAAREAKKPAATPATEKRTVTLKTSAGDIQVETLPGAAPCTVNSFVSLAEQKYYDDTVCHRLVEDGILQCGDPSGTGSGGPGYSFADELTGSETYTRGTVAMANGGPDTNGSQFFLVFADSAYPPGYTKFGTIDEAGLKVLETLNKLGTEGAVGDGPPAKEVRIEAASVS